jgi:hypothetical protein
MHRLFLHYFHVLILQFYKRYKQVLKGGLKMKKSNIFLIISVIAVSVILLCSCSRGSVRRLGDASRDVVRRGANFIDSGINAVENGVENGMDTIIGNEMYGANSGYSANAAIGTNGTNYSNEGTATEINPTLRSKSRNMDRRTDRFKDKTNKGEINSNNGNSDGGLGNKKR